MPRKNPEDANFSQASTHEKILRLLALDWSQAPYSIIMKEFPTEDRQRFYEWRQTEIYRTTMAAMVEEHQKRLLAMPGTSSLRQYIQYGMGLAIRRLIDILSTERSTNKDVIAAARLTAQLDGRFLRTDNDGDVSPDERQESVASELVRALERAKQTVQ